MKAACEGENATVCLDKQAVISVRAEGRHAHATRNGLICAVAVAAAVWSSYPVAEMGVIDDWSYIKTAQVFALTGHFVYNGWSAMILGWQVVWGALFIKLFGFSFTVVRLSTLPIAMATIFLFHAILLRFGINARNAVVGTLALGLSPLFVPLAATYMTDVPGLFAIVLCLYLCQRAVAASSSKVTIAWLCLAAATNVAGGTARQIAWLGALVIVPSSGWLLRKRREVLTATSLLWVISIGIISACMRWYTHQPYSVPETLLKGLDFNHPGSVIYWGIHSLAELGDNTLYLLMFVYPILVAWLPQLRTLNGAAFLRIAIMTATLFFFLWATIGMLPSLPYVFLALLVIATSLVLMERQNLWPRIQNKKVQFTFSREIAWLMGPFSVCYFGLLATRETPFDRYLLPLMPIAIICLLRLHQEWIAPTLPAISIVVLGIFALLGVAGMHDSYALYRARLAAINEIRASGVPRTAIQGGSEYDGWTQIEAAGYINEPRIRIPTGAYHPDVRPQLVPDDCKFKFAPYTPAIHPKFTIAFGKMWCLAPSKFPPVGYRTWLPPYNRKILVQQIPDL